MRAGVGTVSSSDSGSARRPASTLRRESTPSTARGARDSGALPEGPLLYPDAETTDEPTETRIAELIREAALEGVRDELPHSLAVSIDETETKGALTVIHATVHVERDSQKPIVLGKNGARLRSVGTEARHQIEALLGGRVYLDLHVNVLKDWQRDPRQLRRLGF